MESIVKVKEWCGIESGNKRWETFLTLIRLNELLCKKFKNYKNRSTKQLLVFT